MESLGCVLAATVRGARGSRVPLIIGLSCTRRSRRRRATKPHFHAPGWAARPMTTDKDEVAGPRWVRTASGTAGPRRARAVTVGDSASQVTGPSSPRPCTAQQPGAGFESHPLRPAPAPPALVRAGAALSVRALVGQMLTLCSQGVSGAEHQAGSLAHEVGVAVDQPGQQRVPGHLQDLGRRLAGVQYPLDPLPRITRARPSRTVPAAGQLAGSLQVVCSARERRMRMRFLVRVGPFV
jgi:hypothetical protein